MKRYNWSWEGMERTSTGDYVDIHDVQKIQEEVEHLREYTDHLVNFSKLPCLPKDLENLREANSKIASENDSLKKERDLYVREFTKAVNAASIFQCGGKYSSRANLMIGGSSIVDGIKWADQEIERLDNEISGWKNKYDCAVEMAAQSEFKRLLNI